MIGTNSLERLTEAVVAAHRHWDERKAESPAGPAFTITLSREAGANGTQIAHLVGERLGWPVYDRELLQKIADEMGLHTRLLESLDEKRVRWLEGAAAGFGSAPTVSESAYLRRLLKTVLSLGAHGHCVLVGRGAAQILPAPTTLRVRLVAPLEDRITTTSQKRGMSREEARRYVARTDEERFYFVSGHFHKDPASPEQYDLVLNTARFSAEACAELIVEALGRLRESVPLRS
jgi:cytidylate kinase